MIKFENLNISVQSIDISTTSIQLDDSVSLPLVSPTNSNKKVICEITPKLIDFSDESNSSSPSPSSPASPSPSLLSNQNYVGKFKEYVDSKNERFSDELFEFFEDNKTFRCAVTWKDTTVTSNYFTKKKEAKAHASQLIMFHLQTLN